MRNKYIAIIFIIVAIVVIFANNKTPLPQQVETSKQTSVISDDDFLMQWRVRTLEKDVDELKDKVDDLESKLWTN